MLRRLLIICLLLIAAAVPAHAVKLGDGGKEPGETAEADKAALLESYADNFCTAMENPDSKEFSYVFHIPFMSRAMIPDAVLDEAGKTREESNIIMANALREVFRSGEIKNCSVDEPYPVECAGTFSDYEPSIMGGVPVEQIVKQLTDANSKIGIEECVILPMIASGMGSDQVELLEFVIGWSGQDWRSLGFLDQNRERGPESEAPGQ